MGILDNLKVARELRQRDASLSAELLKKGYAPAYGLLRGESFFYSKSLNFGIGLIPILRGKNPFEILARLGNSYRLYKSGMDNRYALESLNEILVSRDLPSLKAEEITKISESDLISIAERHNLELNSSISLFYGSRPTTPATDEIFSKCEILRLAGVSEYVANICEALQEVNQRLK